VYRSKEETIWLVMLVGNGYCRSAENKHSKLIQGHSFDRFVFFIKSPSRPIQGQPARTAAAAVTSPRRSDPLSVSFCFFSNPIPAKLVSSLSLSLSLSRSLPRPVHRYHLLVHARKRKVSIASWAT
jgi:hypothetical protein